MQAILNIATEFFDLNDIEINSSKTTSIVLNEKRTTNHTLTIKRQQIRDLQPGEKERYLGIYLSTQGIKQPTTSIIEQEINNTLQKIKRKAITDKQAHYILHHVLIPIVEYRSQATYLPPITTTRWDTKIRNAFRRKARLSKDHPIECLQHPNLYNIKSIADLQAESKITHMLIRLNTPGIVQDLVTQQIVKSQLTEWLPTNHLTKPVQHSFQSRHLLIIGISEILHSHQIQIPIPKYPIKQTPGSNTICDLVSHHDYQRLYSFLRTHHIMYSHQIANVKYPRKYMDIIE